MKAFADATESARARPARRASAQGKYRYTRLKWRILCAIFDAVGGLLSRFRRRDRDEKNALASREPRSILIVQLDHLGDAIITAATLPALRRRFPLASIDVLAAEWNREIFETCPEVDRVHVSRVNRFSRGGDWRWVGATLWWGWKLRRWKYDLGFDVRGEFPLALILWLAGIPRRIGWACGGGGFLLTDVGEHVAGRPEIASRAELLRLVGIPSEASLPTRAWFDPGVVARDRARRRLEAAGLIENEFVVFHVGAGTAAKRWPATYWRELLGRLIVGLGRQVVLVGSASEQSLAREILDGQDWPGVWDWTGETRLAETAALIEQAAAFVGADSGPAHLAAAVGRPVVALFSGTNDERQWRPWGEQVRVTRVELPCSPCHRETCAWSDHPCMRRMPADRVYGELHSLLELGAVAERVPDAAAIELGALGTSPIFPGVIP